MITPEEYSALGAQQKRDYLNSLPAKERASFIDYLSPDPEREARKHRRESVKQFARRVWIALKPIKRPKAVKAKTAAPIAPKSHDITCPQCQTAMQLKRVNEADYGLQAVGCLLVLVALPMLIIFPIGTLVGVLLLSVGSRIGFKSSTRRVCPSCGYHFEVAKR